MYENEKSHVPIFLNIIKKQWIIKDINVCYPVPPTMRTNAKPEVCGVHRKRHIFPSYITCTHPSICLTPSNLIPNQIIISKLTNFGLLCKWLIW